MGKQAKNQATTQSMMISPKDISVVVQGPIQHQGDLTRRVLESVRTHLPDAELILSTWKGSDVSGLECDVLLLNDDPGSLGTGRKIDNVNRQIVSTRNGLQKATRQYAVKMRTDTLLTGTGFLDAFDRYPERRDDFKVFEHKVVITDLYTRNPRHLYIYAPDTFFFHPSDIFQFGLRQDLLLLWGVPLCTKNTKCAPEQYIWSSCLNLGYYSIDYLSLNLYKRYVFSEISFVNNFIMCTSVQAGIKLPPQFPDNHACYTLKEFDNLYQHYVVRRSNSLPTSLLPNLFWVWLFASLKDFHLHLGLRRFFIKLSPS